MGRHWEGEHEVGVDRVLRRVQATLLHRIARVLIAIGPVEGESGSGGEEPPGGALLDAAGSDADKRDLGPEHPTRRAEDQQRIREAPGMERQARLEHASARDNDDVVPARPGRDPDDIDSLARHLGRASHDARRAVLVLLAPQQRHCCYAESSPDAIGTRAHGVDARVRVGGPQVGERRFQRAVVPGVARAEQAKHPDSGASTRSGGRAWPAHAGPPCQAATTRSMELGSSALACASGSTTCPCCPVCVRLASHRARWP